MSGTDNAQLWYNEQGHDQPGSDKIVTNQPVGQENRWVINARIIRDRKATPVRTPSYRSSGRQIAGDLTQRFEPIRHSRPAAPPATRVSHLHPALVNVMQHNYVAHRPANPSPYPVYPISSHQPHSFGRALVSSSLKPRNRNISPGFSVPRNSHLLTIQTNIAHGGPPPGGSGSPRPTPHWWQYPQPSGQFSPAYGYDASRRGASHFLPHHPPVPQYQAQLPFVPSTPTPSFTILKRAETSAARFRVPIDPTLPITQNNFGSSGLAAPPTTPISARFDYERIATPHCLDGVPTPSVVDAHGASDADPLESPIMTITRLSPTPRKTQKLISPERTIDVGLLYPTRPLSQPRVTPIGSPLLRRVKGSGDGITRKDNSDPFEAAPSTPPGLTRTKPRKSDDSNDTAPETATTPVLTEPKLIECHSPCSAPFDELLTPMGLIKAKSPSPPIPSTLTSSTSSSDPSDIGAVQHPGGKGIYIIRFAVNSLKGKHGILLSKVLRFADTRHIKVVDAEKRPLRDLNLEQRFIDLTLQFSNLPERKRRIHVQFLHGPIHQWALAISVARTCALYIQSECKYDPGAPDLADLTLDGLLFDADLQVWKPVISYFDQLYKPPTSIPTYGSNTH